MKKIKLFLIVFFLIFFVKNNLFAIDTVSIRYFPMHVGDFWVYSYHLHTSYYQTVDTTYKTKTTVAQSFIKENRIYYKLIYSHSSSFNYLLRTDSISGSLRYYDSLNSCIYYYKEKLYDSLSAQVGDTVSPCHNPGPSSWRCFKIDTISIFGTNKIRKGFNGNDNFGQSHSSYYEYFTLDFGGTHSGGSWSSGAQWGYSTTILLGCRINGVVYGDTSMTSVKNLSSEIPDRFELYQNYPNPFNNTSNLKFQIVNTGDVKLVVYDIMGREVQTLVNERLQPGTYETSFDGTNFPSGVYYYRLEAGDFVKSKGMILIK